MTMTTPFTGATSDEHCVCKPGFRQTDGQAYRPGDCKRCDGNSVSSIQNATTCIQCTDQTQANSANTFCVASDSTRKTNVIAKVTSNASLCREDEQERVCSQVLLDLPNS